MTRKSLRRELMSTLNHHSHRLDPARIDLALEFRAQPFGIRSAELAVLLNRMRSLPLDGKHLLVETIAGQEWMLAQMMGVPPNRIELRPEHVFSDYEEAEWFVFKLRWEVLCGEPLVLPREGDSL